MRFQFLLIPLLAAGCLVAAPVCAQRASLADRMAALEQQMANDRGNVDLLNQVTALKSEVQALRAQVEELQHESEQFKQSSRSQYLDLDGRLNRLQGGAPPAPPTTSPAVPMSDADAVGGNTVTDSVLAVHGDAGTLAKGANERSRYEAAFDTLKAGHYVESARQFGAFLQQYPSGVYAPNALYWLGESYYVTQNYALAQQQFQTLLDRYPTHDKAAGALLKVGLSQYGLKQMEAAQATLLQVVKRYPGTVAARTADDRLRAMQLQQAR